MEVKIDSVKVTGGWFSYLIHTTTDEDIKGSWGYTQNGWNFITNSTKGVFHGSQEDSERDLLKVVGKEVKRLEGNTDLRPSQTRRLQILKVILPQ